MAYEFFYEENNLNPSKSPYSTGYTMPAGDASSNTLDPRTANQLQDFSNKANIGGRVLEISTISPEVMDSIPKQHLTEIGRVAKLTGVDPTMHGPMIEASGYTQQGWTETGRAQAEKQMFSAIERAHDISPDGNMNVTFHSSTMLPQQYITMKEKDKEGNYVEKIKSFMVVDPITGQIEQIKEKEKHFPEQKGYENFYPDMELKRLNKENWYRTLNSIDYHASIGEDALKRTTERMKENAENLLRKTGKEITPEDNVRIQQQEKDLFKAYASGNLTNFSPENQQIFSDSFRSFDHAKIFLKDSYNSLRELYNRAYKDADDEDKKKLKQYADSVSKDIFNGIEDKPERLQEFSKIVQNGIKVLTDIKNPNIYRPLNEFVIEKSAETFGKVAFESYNKFGDKAPIIAIENPPAGGALSRAGELKELIEKSRDEFVNKAVKSGMGESEARDAAKKIIGATWDVGHINMLRKYGYDKKDMIKEAGIIAPYVKKVHLSDNFGMEHTELPMGMGNVPIKEIMEKLGKEGFEAKKIVEAGSWWSHFRTPPTNYSLEALGSPVYGMMMGPYWNQLGGLGSYSSGMGTILPEQNFSIYGSGFTSLPTELGGQIAGRQSRMSGTPVD